MVLSDSKLVDDNLGSAACDILTSGGFASVDEGMITDLLNAARAEATEARSRRIEQLEERLNPAPDACKDIHIHDDDWETTYGAIDVFEMLEDLDPGQVVEISRLLRIPPVWAAIVAADNGDTGITLHSSRGEAERALLPTLKEPSDDR